MPTKLMDAAYWHDRAEEARAQAEEMRNESAKRTLLEIAANYDQLAAQAESRRRGGKSDIAEY